jgi:hypothetical protein
MGFMRFGWAAVVASRGTLLSPGPRTRWGALGMVAAGLVSSGTSAAGDVSFTWQSRLVDVNGQPIATTQDVTITLYDSADTELWSKLYDDQPIDDGYAAIVLTGLDDLGRDLDAVAFDAPVYLGVALGGVELSPRQRIGAVPGSASGGGSAGPPVALVDGATIPVNAGLGQTFTLTIGGNRSLANPTGLVDGETYTFRITQDGTGGRTLAFGSAYRFNGDVAPILSGGPGKKTVLHFTSDGTALYHLGTYAEPSCVPGSQTFLYTGADQTFNVPSGCFALSVKLWGAGGGGGYPTSGSGASGGGGGFASANLAVTQGQSLTIVVGQGGQTSSTSNGCTGFAYGGGGRGCVSGHTGAGGGGGGRSAIRSGATELVTAGGGGGAGGHFGPPSAGVGGPGGGTDGVAGSQANGGGGGTQFAGGSAAAVQYGGTNGAAFQGGDGGHINGGGGGGWYGGAGGGHVGGSGVSAGGGGGSGYVSGAGVSAGVLTGGTGTTPGGTAVSGYSSGVGVGGGSNTVGGDGRVIITW